MKRKSTGARAGYIVTCMDSSAILVLNFTSKICMSNSKCNFVSAAIAKWDEDLCEVMYTFFNLMHKLIEIAI